MSLLKRLCIVFGEPSHSADPDAFLAEMDRLVKSYSAAEQNHAADVLIGAHKPSSRRPWPAPSDICGACADAREALAPRKSEGERWPAWSDSRRQRAAQMIVCALGQQAADEGWITALWDFCRTQERLPNEAEAYRCRVAAREFAEAYAAFTRDPGVPALAGVIRRGFEERFAKRDALARIAHGEVIDGFRP